MIRRRDIWSTTIERILVRLGRRLLETRVEAHLRALKERAVNGPSTHRRPRREVWVTARIRTRFLAGLRRNAVALAAGIVIVVALFVVVPIIAPRLVGSSAGPARPWPHRRDHPDHGSRHPGRLIEVLDGIEGGPKTRRDRRRLPPGPNGLEARPEFDVGDEVIVNISTDPEAASSPSTTAIACPRFSPCSCCSRSR